MMFLATNTYKLTKALFGKSEAEVTLNIVEDPQFPGIPHFVMQIKATLTKFETSPQSSE